MDPFSITVGAISLASVTRKAIGRIMRLKALQNAPEELQDLLTELSQFEMLLQAIEDTRHPSESGNSHLESLLGRAKDKMVEWESLVEYRLTKAGTSSKVDRLQWIGSSKAIGRLREQLKDIRDSLNALIGIRTSTTARETLQLMRQLHLEYQNYRAMASALVPFTQILEEEQSRGINANRILSNFPHYTTQTSDPGPQSVSGDTHNHSAQRDRKNAYARSRHELQVQKTSQIAHCRSDCICECHRTRTSFTWSSGFLANIFGRACLESRGPSSIRASCHIRSCKASTVSEVRVIYFIPAWIAMKAIFIRYTSSPLHGPEWLIRIPRLVEWEKSRAFISIPIDDLPGFESAITSGECTPDDIDKDGHSLVYHVVLSGRHDMLLHLLKIGVDILQPVDVGPNWLEMLWSLFVKSRTFLRINYPSTFQDLIPHFPWDEYKEKKSFTLIHEIVCGFSSRDLDSAIRTHPADINRLDYRHRSPLLYAVDIPNISAIRTLLKRGADLNVPRGKLIDQALFLPNAKSPEIIELLLCSGIAVDRYVQDFWVDKSHYNATPWYLAIDKLLIEHGFDVNHRYQGRTLLMILCVLGVDSILSNRIEQLIAYGANLELKDSKGNTALHYAVIYQSSTAMKSLFQAGAHLGVRSNRNDTIAHLAVSFSTSVGFVTALSEISLVRLDLTHRNEDSHTAYDLLRKRNGLRWEKHCEELEQNRWQPVYGGHFYWKFFVWKFGKYRAQKDEYEVILALEALLHQIQDSQGVPKDQQYPPLGPYLSDDKDEEPIPGAWPV